MAQGLKINRARRSVLKTVGILAAAFVGTTGAYKPAAAKHDDDDGSCFLRGTQVQTAKGYRAIETLATGDKVATRFAGFAPIKAIDVFTLESRGWQVGRPVAAGARQTQRPWREHAGPGSLPDGLACGVSSTAS